MAGKANKKDITAAEVPHIILLLANEGWAGGDKWVNQQTLSFLQD